MEFTNKADILVFYVNAMDSVGDDGGRIRGCSVHYLFFGDQGTNLVGVSEPDATKPIGMQRGKSWVDYELRNKIRVAPAIYEGTFLMTIGGDGKPVLKLSDVAYKCNVEFRPYTIPGLYVPGMVNPPEYAAAYENPSEASSYKPAAPERAASPEKASRTQEPKK